ncbi:MAG: biopolymer transporter ExbD [Myxococcota bacterium]
MRRRRKPVMTLQLTSLLDMFTIILVFLLESFQAEDEDFTLHAGLSLPESTARSAFKPAVNIALSEDAIFVEGTEVHALNAGAADDGGVGYLEDVAVAIEAAWKTRRASQEGEEFVASIQADEGIPYETVDLVMRSAADRGCYRFRLVVEKGG